MDHVLSTHLFVNQRLTTTLLNKIHQAGIPAVEIFCLRQHLDYRNQAQVQEIGHWFRDSPLRLHSMHSPMFTDEVWGRSGRQSVIDISEPRKAQRIQQVDEVKRALEIAEYAPFTYLIQHIGYDQDEYDERRLDAAFTSLEEIRIFGKQRGVEVLVENIPNAFSSSQRLVEFLRMTHLPIGFCFDTGHANLNEGVEEAFETMKDRIRSTHVHDNDGHRDSHLFPMFAEAGTINWGRTMDLFRARANQFPLVLELKEQPGVENPFQMASRVFEELERVTANVER